MVVLKKKELVLYSREKCPLCDKAKILLDELKEELDFSYREVDIYQDDELIERFGLMIPVLESNGEIIQYGIIDQVRLRAYFIK
jgi:glutaredoxin